jgi:hypothetical protein
MLEHERKVAKRKGDMKSYTYKPRQEHPLLKKKVIATEDDTTIEESLNLALEEESESEEKAKREAERLLFHTKHHCDSIDPRDVQALRQYARAEACFNGALR